MNNIKRKKIIRIIGKNYFKEKKEMLKNIKTKVFPIDAEAENDIIEKTEPTFQKQNTELTIEEKKNSESKKRIVINAKGTRFEVFTKCLDKHPDTRLGKLKILLQESKDKESDVFLELCDDYDLKKMEFYFDRNPNVLESVLEFYKNGQLHFTNSICVKVFMNELNYWQIDESSIDDCCQFKYAEQKALFEDEVNLKKTLLAVKYHKTDYGTLLPELREKIWLIMEKPFASWIGTVIINFVLFFLFLIILNLFI